MHTGERVVAGQVHGRGTLGIAFRKKGATCGAGGACGVGDESARAASERERARASPPRGLSRSLGLGLNTSRLSYCAPSRPLQFPP